MLNESLPVPPEALQESQSPRPRLVHVSSEDGGLVRDDTGNATAVINVLPPLPPVSRGNRTREAADAPAISEFDALPDLVNDLDLSDDSGQQRLVERSNGEPMEASSPPAIDRDSIALMASSSTSSVSVDARSSGSAVHGSSSINSRTNGFLIDPIPSVRPSSVVPIPRFLHPDSSAKPIDSGHHHHHSSRRSSSSYNHHSQMLLQHADRMWTGLVPNIMEICSQFDFICRWDAKHHPQQHSFMPFLVDLLSKFNGLSMTASGVGRYATVYLHVSSRLRDEASQYLSVGEENKGSSSSPLSPRLVGYLTFLIHFLHDHQILKQLMSDEVFTRAESAHLTTVVVGLVGKLLKQAELLQEWPSWLSPAFVLMNQIA